MNKGMLCTYLIACFHLLNAFASPDSLTAEVDSGTHDWTTLSWMDGGTPFSGSWDSILSAFLKVSKGDATVHINQALSLNTLMSRTAHYPLR